MMICKGCGEEKPKYCKGMCKRCYGSDYRKKNRDKRRENKHRWDIENREYRQEVNRKYYIKNREAELERGALRRKNNPYYHNEWCSNNREKDNNYKRRYKQQRRAKVNNLPNTLTAQDWQEILDCWDYRCAYCGEHDFNLQQEHVIPVCQDGGYTIENIVPACRSCNSKKGGKTPIEAGMSFYNMTGTNPVIKGEINDRRDEIHTE